MTIFIPKRIVGGGGAFHPTDISGLVGLFHVDDLTGVYQEDTQSTAAAVDSAVGYLPDRSGQGNHVDQATAGNRPILRNDGTDNYLEFDGSNDRLEMVSAGAVGVGTVIAGGRLAASSGYNGLVTNAADQGTDVDFAFSSNFGGASWDTGQSAGGGLGDSSHFWEDQTQTNAITNDTNVVWSVDGTDHPGDLEFPNGFVIGRDRGLASRFFNGRVYAIAIYDSILSQTDRENVEVWIASRCGVTF